MICSLLNSIAIIRFYCFKNDTIEINNSSGVIKIHTYHNEPILCYLERVNDKVTLKQLPPSSKRHPVIRKAPKTFEIK